MRKSILLLLSGLFLNCAGQQASAQNAITPAEEVAATAAQKAVFRYARITGLAEPDRIHGTMIPKTALVELFQQRDCEGVRVFYARDDKGNNMAILWPTDAQYQNMERRQVMALPANDLCPGNCDFQFMQDNRFLPLGAGTPTFVDARAALKWIERYARNSNSQQTTSFLIQKSPVLESLINNRGTFGIRAYHTLEPDLLNPALYLVGTDYYGRSNWAGKSYYADNTNLCISNCY